MKMKKDTTQRGKISFKPLSEGLGLDHFVDGLPYAPPQAKRKPMVHFNFPPVKPTPEPTTTRTQIIQPLAKPIASSNLQPIAQSQMKKEFVPAIENSGYLKRIFGYAIDTLFVIGIYIFLLWAGLSLNGYSLSQIKNYHYFFPLFLLYLMIHIGYFLIQETTCSYTLGKTLMKIRIQSESELATAVRVFCFFMSSFPLGIGLFWYFFDPKRRCWHDVITDTEVINT